MYQALPFLLFPSTVAFVPIVAVIPQPNASVEVCEVPSPELEKDSALLDVELSEVCGTDVYLQQVVYRVFLIHWFRAMSP